MRPIGSALYLSLPLRFGLPADYIIISNFLLITASIVLSGLAVGEMVPEFKRNGAGPLRKWLYLTMIHMIFMLGDARTALLDVPAACLALAGVWLFIMGSYRSRAWMLWISGLALGLSAFIRAFYLYPALLTLSALIFIHIKFKISTNPAVAGFAIFLLAPVFFQFNATHEHTGHWTFLNKESTAYWANEHFKKPLYGYDTYVKNGGEGMQPYDAAGCFGGESGIKGAVENMDIYGIACLVLKRQVFLFGSYADQTYISTPRGRTFSVWIAVLHTAAMVFAFVGILYSEMRKSFIVPLLLIGAIWAEGSLIVPETRFIMVLYVFIWVIGLASAAHYAGRIVQYWGGLDSQPKLKDELDGEPHASN
ncbi:MAG TPA: hypothetical protein VI702_04515 [Nitrospiria bacterium]